MDDFDNKMRKGANSFYIKLYFFMTVILENKNQENYLIKKIINK